MASQLFGNDDSYLEMADWVLPSCISVHCHGDSAKMIDPIATECAVSSL